MNNNYSEMQIAKLWMQPAKQKYAAAKCHAGS